MYYNQPLNLFYSEPDPDRWFKYDRYPRKLIRRLIRGQQKPGGVMMVALNLMQGLDRLGIPYRFNNYKYIAKHPDEIACIIGKPQVLYDRNWKNPLIFGPGIFSHPADDPDLLKRHPNIKLLLVPGPWMKEMFIPYYGNKVIAWPTGIDTEKWAPAVSEDKKIDFLIYDKIHLDREHYLSELLKPVLTELEKRSLTYTIIRYGHYTPATLKQALDNCKAAIFLCQNETQGLAYQQILSAGVPILAWDRGGYWQDPSYYPAIKYGPVSSVPYWSEGCGLKFISVKDFEARLTEFNELNGRGRFQPRKFILENLSLEKCAEAYVNIFQSVEKF